MVLLSFLVKLLTTLYPLTKVQVTLIFAHLDCNVAKMPTPYEFHAAFFSMKFPKREQNESIPQYEQRVRDSLHVQINHNREQAQKGKLFFYC